MKLGILGLGFMGRTHLQALKNIPHGEVVAVASDDPVALTGDLSGVQGNLGTSGERFDFSAMRTYSDWRDALKDSDVEAVDICLPTHLHGPCALAALEAGKHVLVEKPLGLSGDDCDRILDAAAKSDRLLMTAQVLRFFPDYIPLVNLQRSGELGPLRLGLFRRRCSAPTWGAWLPDPSKSGGGVFDLLIHDVDMMLHLFGPPESVSATGCEDLAKGIDVIGARCRYSDGSTVIITGGWHHPQSYPFSMEYTVTFDGGTVEYSSAGRPPTLYKVDGSEQVLEKPEKDGYQAEIEYFLECATSGRKPEICPPEESATAVKLMHRLTEARARKGEVIACNL